MRNLDRNRLENDVVKELHSRYEAKKVNGNEIRFRSISNYEGDKTPSAYFNTTKKFFKDFSTGEGGGLVTLAKLLNINLNNYVIKDNNQTNENKTFIDEKLKNYWKNRGIKKLPNSITTNSNKNIAYYLTYNTPEKETLFQYCYMSDTSTKNGTTNKAFKRLNKKGEAITNLYIPYEWEYYKPKQENNQPEDNKKIKPNVLYICEGVSDCLTLNHCGYKAIAIRSKGSLTDRKGLTKSELKKFIDETKPERVIVIPDPDGFKEWKKHFTKYFTEWQYESYSFIDIKLYTTKDIKIDSNELFRFSDYDVKSFRQRLYWLLNQSTTIDYGTIFKNYPKKYYEGYNKKSEIIPVSNFIMIFRKIYTDKNTKYEYEKTEVTFINDRINKTIILDSNNFVYAKFESIIKSLGAELWISKAHLNEILKLEIQYRQLKNRIEYYDKFGHIEDDLVLFKNVAFYKGKPYFQTSDDYIEIGNKIVQCVSQDAPELKIGCKDDVNKSFVETLTKAYGFNGILALAYNLGSVRMKPVIDKLGIHPINYAVGTKGVGKSKMFDYVLKLFGTRTHKLTGIDTATSIRRTCAKYNYLPVIINEFDYRNTKYSDLTLFLCDAYDRKIRGTAQFTNDNSVRESSMNAFINISSNEMPENTHKLFRRSFYIQMLQKDLNKSYRIDLDNFAEQSNIIYKLYQLDLDVINLFNDYDLMLKQNDINDPNIHIPYYIGFEILRKLNLITEEQLKEYCNQLLFLARKQDKDLSVNNDVIKFIEFMHLLSCEEMRRDKDDSHNTIIHTTIMPNKHYAIRGDSKKYMIININLTMEIVNSYCRKNGHKTFDLKVFKGALSECDFFDNGWTDNKKYDKVASIGGDKVRTWRLDLEKLEEFGFTFRETPAQSVEEILASAFDEYEEPLSETVEVTAENVNEMEDLCLSLTRKDKAKAEKLFKAINTYFGKNRATTNQIEYETFVRFFTIKVEKIAC